MTTFNDQVALDNLLKILRSNLSGQAVESVRMVDDLGDVGFRIIFSKGSVLEFGFDKNKGIVHLEDAVRGVDVSSDD
jgi:hypothetical protein